MKLLIFLLLFQESGIGIIKKVEKLDNINCRFYFEVKLPGRIIYQPIDMPCDWITKDSIVRFSHYEFKNIKNKK